MSAFTRDEIIAQLVAKNVPRHLAERAADAELAGIHAHGGAFGQEVLENGVRRNVIWTAERAATHQVQRFEAMKAEPAPAIAWPLRLVLPWSCLVSDNDKFVAKLIRDARANEGFRAIMVITDRYAAAKAKIAQLAASKIGDATPVKIPLAITARVFMPDARDHDAPNFAKLVRDALEKVVYVRDAYVRDDRWTHAGVDVDAPRAEITITPIPS